MFFRIASVDENGFLGRDHHPSKDHVGLIVVAVGMTSMIQDAEGNLTHTLDDGYGRPVAGSPAGDAFVIDESRRAIAYQFDNPDAAVLTRMWTCVTSDGRVLNLLDHEIEPATLDRDVREAAVKIKSVELTAITDDGIPRKVNVQAAWLTGLADVTINVERSGEHEMGRFDTVSLLDYVAEKVQR